MHPLFIVALSCVVLPILIYFCAKAASFGWTSGKRVWAEHQERKQMKLFESSTKNK